MKIKTIKHKNFNGGKQKDMSYVITERELASQMLEIYDNDTYKYGYKKNGVYLDIGANMGLATHYFSDTAKMIYAFEPSPNIYNTLVKNTEGMKNVKTYNMAVGIHNEKDYLYASGDNEPQSLFFEGSPDRCEVVQSITLEKFLKDNNIEHIDTMKIDIEGFEYSLLMSKEFENIADRIDCIVGEAHFSAYGSGFPEAIPVILNKYGFTTDYPKTNNINVKRIITFDNPITGFKREHVLKFNTMFRAIRK